jgi:hypothetical protein
VEINRSNYEIWIIDWIDGNLIDMQIEQLKLFLSKNPDLKKEFDELAIVPLTSSEKSFPDKDLLKKSTADLSGSQFEYLCIAYLENDLSNDQQTELFEIIGQDREKKRSFELLQKMRLSPADISYNYKHRLKKRTVIQNVIRLSVIGLSAAATIALFIISYLLIPRNLSVKSKDGVLAISKQNIQVDSNQLQTAINKQTGKKEAEFRVYLPEKINKTLIAAVHKNSSGIHQKKQTVSIPNDSLPDFQNNSETVPEKIPVHSTIDIKGGFIENNLIAYNPVVTIPVYDDERSKLSRFIAKTFREKILKKNTSKDIPLQGYEIAEAGVTGLNKLFGWEMALDEKNDENGKLKSVYFSSKLLKFNAPVKKSDSLP